MALGAIVQAGVFSSLIEMVSPVGWFCFWRLDMTNMYFLNTLYMYFSVGIAALVDCACSQGVMSPASLRDLTKLSREKPEGYLLLIAR